MELHSLLYAAIKGGHSDVLEELLSADVLDKGWDQAWALQLASGCWQVFSKLLPYCKERQPVVQLGEVLCSEARSGCPQTIEALLLHGVSVNYISKYGTTALHDTAIKGNMQAVQKLLSCGADATLCVSDPSRDAGLDGTGASHSAIHAYDIGFATAKGRTALELSTSKAVTQCLHDHIHASQVLQQLCLTLDSMSFSSWQTMNPVHMPYSFARLLPAQSV
ncbi:hypothetical protein ABBQ38_014258 [Trebouxia sp. C0009 RCD-2024]